MHHAVHVSRISLYTSLGKQVTLSLNLLPKCNSDDIRGSDGSIYAEESAYVNARSFFLNNWMALCVMPGWGSKEFSVQNLHGCAFVRVLPSSCRPLCARAIVHIVMAPLAWCGCAFAAG